MKLVKDAYVNENVSVKRTDTLEYTISIMDKGNIGVVVVLENTKVIGVITEIDIVNIIDLLIDTNTAIESIFKFKNIIDINFKRSVEYALHVLIDNSIRRLVVVDDADNYIGVVTQDILLQHLDEDIFKTNLTIESILDNDLNLMSLHVDDSINQAFSTMKKFNMSSLIVVDDTDIAVGILTERDSINILNTKINMNLAVSEIMSSPVISVEKDILVKDVVELMYYHEISRVLVIESDSRKPLYVLTARDIAHNLKGNYTRILESKLKNLKSTLNFMGESILETYEDNNEHIIHWMNETAMEKFGDMVDKRLLDFVNPDEWSKIYKEVSINGKCSKCRIEIKGMYFELMCSYHYVNKKETLLMILRDISTFENEIIDVKEVNQNLENKIQHELKKNKKQELLMFQQSRLAQMGEMISMIAHQWRQPLNNLSILSQSIFFKYKRGKISDTLMEEFNVDSKKQIKDMSNTIDDFRDFFKPEKEKTDFFVHKSLNKTIELLSPVFKKQNIEIILEEIEEVALYGYPNEFSQSIVNILNNSKDALIENEIEDKRICIEVQVIDKKMILEIKDNAGGIPKEILNKIFNPYFSTKEDRNGTGLGLYMSRLIIQEHMQGKLTALNHDGGALFKVELDTK